MQQHPPISEFAVAIASTTVTFLLSIQPLRYGFAKLLSKQRRNVKSEGLYRDEDGVATVESVHAFSDRIVRCVLLGVSAFGVALSAFFLAGSYTGALCFLTGDKDSCQQRHDAIWIEQCFVLLSWVLLLLQSCILFTTRLAVQRFRLGLYGAVSAFALAIALPVEALQWTSRKHTFLASALHATLLLVEFLFALALTFTFLLLPRRPDVYLDGKIVDRQYTVSAWDRATFGWATPVLNMTAKNRNIGHDALPMVSSDSRAHNLRTAFDDVGRKDKLCH